MYYLPDTLLGGSLNDRFLVSYKMITNIQHGFIIATYIVDVNVENIVVSNEHWVLL